MVALRITGDEIVPSDVTSLLGCEPTKGVVKGQKFKHENARLERVAKTGMWSLSATDRQPEDLDSQIFEILGKLSTDLTVWKQIAQLYSLDLFCGLYMQESNEGIIISPSSIRALGERSISASMDIYGPL
jgi:hypothetical protein